MARILVLTSRWPFPSYGGDTVRILNICRELSKHHDITMLGLSDGPFDPVPAAFKSVFRSAHAVRLPRWRSWLNALLALITRAPLQVAYCKSDEFGRRARQHIAESDLILCHLIRTAEYAAGARIPAILEMTDAISLNYERVSNASGRRDLMKSIYSIERTRVLRYELECLQKFALTSLVSAVDRDYLAGKSADEVARKMIVATNGADVERFRVSSNLQGNSLLFLGKMSTVPNIDACEYFARECLPQIRAQRPEIEFWIVGPISPATAARLQRFPGVVICGAVEDLGQVAADCFCGVAPMRLGAGVQNKILDYMAMGIPCVTTTVGHEGLDAVHGREIVVADSAEHLSKAVLDLYADRSAAAAIGEAGRDYVRRCHTWSACLAPLVSAIDQLSTGAGLRLPTEE
jgi:glycosyltransferase involved in cell wall biosynthesis